MGPGHHGHAHGGGEHDAVSRRSRRILAAIAILLAAATVAGLVALWPGNDVRREVSDLGLVQRVYAASVVRVERGPCGGSAEARTVRCDDVQFRLRQGPDEGRIRSLEIPLSPTSPELARGDEIVLNYMPRAEPGFQYTYADRQRRPVLLWLTLLFAAAVVLLGRWRGLAALVGLGVGLAVILRFVLPAIIDGHEPELVAIVGASAIAYLALYLAHGIRTTTTVALLGTLAALGLTVGLATVFSELAHFTGTATEDAVLVKLGVNSIDLSGLVLAGMVLGALGALDDVTVTQATAVGELRLANPRLTRRELYGAGLRIGRDHVASTVNTLALAYAGASLPLLIIFSLSGQSLGTVANGEAVAIEIVSALVGSIGLVAAVPLSTAFATLVTVPPVRGEAETARHAPDELDTDPDALPGGPVPMEPPSDAPVSRRDRRRARRRRAPTPPRRPAPDILDPSDERDFWRR